VNLVLLLILTGVALLIPTAYAGKIGAPYAPTARRAARRAFDSIKLGPEDFLVDLGAGDGSILLDAAARGASSLGYELSPIMWLVIKIRAFFSPCRRGSDSRSESRGWECKKIKLRYANFYKQTLPPETTVVFSFLMPQNMSKVKDFLARQSLPQARYFLSYAFSLPDVEPLHMVHTPKCARVFVYDLRQLTKSSI
jgi:hypothetical protein